MIIMIIDNMYETGRPSSQYPYRDYLIFCLKSKIESHCPGDRNIMSFNGL
jgi:hypothetical protein